MEFCTGVGEPNVFEENYILGRCVEGLEKEAVEEFRKIGQVFCECN